MTKRLLSGLAGVFGLLVNQVNSQNTNFCGTEMPSQQWEAKMQELIAQRKSDANRSQPTAYTIPVIIHVIHGGQSVGTYPNLSQAQLASQVQVLNEDFGGVGFNSGNYNPQAFANYAQNNNLGTSNIDAFGRVKIANTGIQFCLATKDTNGNILPEPGIDRVNYVSRGWSNPAGITSYNSFKNFIDGTIKPGTIWNVSKYLNIWVTDENLNAIGLLGYATFPQFTGLNGLNSNFGTATTDGFWCYAKAFGSQGIASGYYTSGNTRGRTCTHEIGHWVGLRHIWGDGQCASDFCDDTPPASDKNFGAGNYPFKVGSCSMANSPDGEMFMNFMDYTDDPIKYMFTQDQATRIQTAMANSPYRKFMGTHNLCTVTQISANAAFGAPLSVCGTSAAITLSNQSSGVPVPSFTWNVTGGAFINPGPNSPMVALNFPSSGSYTVTLSADNGTTSTVTKVISVYVPTMAVTGADSVECYGRDITLNATGGSYFTWYPGPVVSPTINFPAVGVNQFSCVSVWPGNCKTSTLVTVRAMDCTGIDNYAINAASFKLNPNPVKSAFTVTLPGVSGNIRITDITGKVVKDIYTDAVMAEFEIDATALAPGMYIFSWTAPERQPVSLKFVKE